MTTPNFGFPYWGRGQLELGKLDKFNELVNMLDALIATYQPLDADLTAIAAISSTGILARTGAGTWATRTITGTADEIEVTNGDGVAGNPVVGLPANVTVAGTLSVGVDANVAGDVNAVNDIVAGGDIFGDDIRESGGKVVAPNTYVRFSNAIRTGTYSQSGTTITVTLTDHRLTVGDTVTLDFTTGTAVDGTFTVVTTPASNQFTVTAAGSLTTSGNVSMTFVIFGTSLNVSSVTDIGTGSYTVNYTTSYASRNYKFIVHGGIVGTTGIGFFLRINGVNPILEDSITVITSDSSGAASNNENNYLFVYGDF